MMKKIIIAVTVIAVLLLIGNNYYQTIMAKSKATQVAGPTINTVTSENETRQLLLATVDISGFDCPTCPVSVEYALKDQKGVLDAKVTQSGQGSKIIYDANSVTVDDFRKVVDPFIIEVVSEGPTIDTKLN